jgi:hypothetical protein
MDDRGLDGKTTLPAKLGAGVLCKLIDDPSVFQNTEGMRIKVRLVGLLH